jgi:hypothetical protein
MDPFEIAKIKIAGIVSKSKTEEDSSHSLNALHWLLSEAQRNGRHSIEGKVYVQPRFE